MNTSEMRCPICNKFLIGSWMQLGESTRYCTHFFGKYQVYYWYDGWTEICPDGVRLRHFFNRLIYLDEERIEKLLLLV
jgi:hypothetical protein